MSVNFTNNLEKAMNYLYKNGAFLTVRSKDKTNTMTISWGNIGYEWGKPVFTVMVRKSRYTYELIENSDSFTVSIPFNDDLKEGLKFCGTKSGRTVDKFKVSTVVEKSSKSVLSPVVDKCGIYYECKILYKHEVNPDNLNSDIKNSSYSNNDYHTVYHGEIVECYLGEE